MMHILILWTNLSNGYSLEKESPMLEIIPKAINIVCRSLYAFMIHYKL